MQSTCRRRTSALRQHWLKETSQPFQGVHFFEHAVSGLQAFPAVPGFIMGPCPQDSGIRYKVKRPRANNLHKMKKENLKILGINVKKNLTMNQLLTLSSEDLLCRENAEKIAVLRELCEEFYYTKTRKTKTVSSPESAAKLFAGKLKYLDREECWIATLDSANGVIGVERISVGNLNSCIFDIKRIVRTCLTHNANSMIVAHNHPSGNVKPSSSDIKQTEQLRDALKLFDIGLIDHIILSDREYFSFSNEMSEKYE